jgi:hypothetical protein
MLLFFLFVSSSLISSFRYSVLHWFKLSQFILLGYCNHFNLSCFLSSDNLHSYSPNYGLCCFNSNNIDSGWNCVLSHFPKLRWHPHYHPSFPKLKTFLQTNLCLVGFEVLMALSTKMTVFWVVALFRLVEVYQRFRGPCCLHHQDNRPVRTSETLVNFYCTTRRYNPEDSHLKPVFKSCVLRKRAVRRTRAEITVFNCKQ